MLRRRLAPSLAPSLALALSLALAACSAAVPGYVPPPLKESKSQLAKPLESGDVREGGGYQMSSAEKAMDCKRLTGSMQITVARLKDPSMRAAPSGAAAAAQGLSGPLFGGSGTGADREALYLRERAKLDAYNAELGAKGCRQLDVEAELARAPDPPGKRY